MLGPVVKYATEIFSSKRGPSAQDEYSLEKASLTAPVCAIQGIEARVEIDPNGLQVSSRANPMKPLWA